MGRAEGPLQTIVTDTSPPPSSSPSVFVYASATGSSCFSLLRPSPLGLPFVPVHDRTLGFCWVHIRARRDTWTEVEMSPPHSNWMIESTTTRCSNDVYASISDSAKKVLCYRSTSSPQNSALSCEVMCNDTSHTVTAFHAWYYATFGSSTTESNRCVCSPQISTVYCRAMKNDVGLMIASPRALPCALSRISEVSRKAWRQVLAKTTYRSPHDPRSHARYGLRGKRIGEAQNPGPEASSVSTPPPRGE